MSQIPAKPNDAVQAQVEALTAVAKKLSSAGNDAQALEAYKTASGLMLGAPWLQHRTAELARKLRQPEVAALHYRRAAAAFIGAGFPKRALAPLRTAWQVAASLLPGDVGSFVTVTLELANVQRELGFAADAKLALSNANQALKAAGCPERVPTSIGVENTQGSPPPSGKSTLPPESGVKTSAAPSFAGALLSRLQAAVKP